MHIERQYSKLLLMVVVLCSLGGVLIAGDSGEGDATGEPRELIVIARLDDIVKSPDCGGFHFGAVARYTIIELLQGRHDRSELGVVHGCPELSRGVYGNNSGSLESFRAGDVHRMVLTSENVHQIGSTVRAEGWASGPLYYCRHVTLHETRKVPGGDMPANTGLNLTLTPLAYARLAPAS